MDDAQREHYLSDQRDRLEEQRREQEQQQRREEGERRLREAESAAAIAGARAAQLQMEAEQWLAAQRAHLQVAEQLRAALS